MLKPISALCLGVLLLTSARAQSPASSATLVLHSAVELEQYLKTPVHPLDAFTNYGKREFLRSLTWGARGLSGFSIRPIERELNSEQALAVARLFGAESYIRPFIQALDHTPPVRLPEPSVALEQGYLNLEAELKTLDQQESSSDSITQRDFQAVIQPYLQAHAEKLSQLAQLSASDLVLLFDGLTMLAMQSLDEQVISEQQRVYAQMRVRQIDTRRGLDESLLRPLMGLRMFDAITTLQARYPHLQAVKLPQVEDSLGKDFVGRSVYRYDVSGSRLVREEFRFAQGKQLVMVVNSGCQFSRDAMDRLSRDTGFAQLAQAANLILLTPPASAAPHFLLEQWNRKHPEWPLRVASNRREWLEIDARAVPLFYLFENGKLIHKEVGWRGDATLAALRKML